ncbi:MAG: pyrroloquinoline quinone biosynthesis protein PqqB [Burkholderiales bacterium]|nr:pyrroloquinoline quinone biosynthesis protein PqqB [Burkholderiales bacterium]MDQ3197321.1 pyrroloquinoline quinone biosynthesis protein PqqB [Pseudomonadota bacterium]
MKVRVLGAAAGGGFPQWNCNCPNCDGLRKGTIKATARTQSSIALTGDDVNWVLFNASPDILAQLKAFPALQPARQLRDTAITAIVLMDSQIDHTTGLLMLREGKPLELYCTDMAREDLTTGNPLFNILGHYCSVNWRRLPTEAGSSFRIDGVAHLSFSALPLKSAAPPYSPHRNDPHEGDNIGMRITDTAIGKSLFYAPGLGEIEPHLREFMGNADCLLVDGTFWTDDEMIKLGVSKKRGREIGHLPQSGEAGMMAALRQFPKPRKVLIHINNTNPILNEESRERAELEAAGIEVAYDGMEIIL